MGQSSIPVLNRLGYSMFWSSVWDDKHRYKHSFLEDAFIRKYIPYVFYNKVSSNLIFNINSTHSKNTNLHFFKKYNLNHNISKHSVSNFLLNFNKLPVYLSKIHIIRFNNWILIYFMACTPNLVKSDNSIFILKNKSYIFQKYMSNVYKNNFLF